MDGVDEQIAGTVCADETFVGGLNKNRHKNKKVEKCQGRSHKDKAPVLGVLRQNEYVHYDCPKTGKSKRAIIIPSVVRCKVVASTGGKDIVPVIKAKVAAGSTFITDEWIGYNGLNAIYDHRVVRHDCGLYVNENGDSSNAIEGFWTGFKLSVKATYQGVSKKHLQKYADEAAYRFNTRTMKDSQRIANVLSLCNYRLDYRTLINKAA